MTVDNSGCVIRFPHFDYPIGISQLQSQRTWLSKELSDAIGGKVEAESMLALPGWFIAERIGRKNGAYVFNPANPKKFFVHSRKKLTPEVIQRISHQLERLCRDVEPSFK